MVNHLAQLQKNAGNLIGHIEPEKVLHAILQQAVDTLGAAGGLLSLVDDEDSTLLCFRFAVGIDRGRVGIRVRATEGLIGEVWRTGETHVQHDYHSCENRISDPRLDRITTVISAPVKVGDEIIGVMQLSWKDQQANITEEKLFAFQQFSHLTSATLENAMLLRHLRDEKSFIGHLFDGMPGLIYMLDSEGRLVRWSKKLEEVSGYSQTDLTGMQFLDFFHGDDVERVFRSIAMSVQNGLTELETDLQTRSGSRLTYYLTTIPLYINNELFIAGIGVDVTLRKELEEELRLHRDRLEAVVEQRTAELSSANQELIAMNEEMTAMNEELQAANCLLEQEVQLRQEKEKLLLLRGHQYRAATRLLTSPADAESERFSLILNDALQLIGAPTGYIGILDADDNLVIRRFCTGSIDFDSMEPQSADSGMMACVFQQGETVHVVDYRTYPGRIGAQELERITTIVMVPLKQGNRIKGLLAAHWLDAVHSIPMEDIEVLQHYSDLASAFLERMETHAEIRNLAYNDPLTGMSNRVSLNLWLDEELSKVRQGVIQGVLFFIDLDELKIVNDTFGHSIGDDMILTAANHIRDAFGQEAFCARIGGDEFIVALTGVQSRESVATLADRLIQVLCREYDVLDEQVLMSASVGVVLYPEHGETPDEIMKNADIAMYAAKASGRNCWRMYETSLQKDAYETMTLTNSLRRALDRGELCLHFQPQICLSDQSIVGFEALLRWNSPEHGSVPPNRFIPLAEKSGVIVSIGEWVIREACVFARRISNIERKSMHVSVNISPRQLAGADFIDRVRSILNETGIEAGQLEMEVTESILIESMEESIGKLEQLRSLGVNIALDDFGTGYSSLTYLRRLPVSTLKVDKSFIDGIIDDVTQAEYVRFIINLAHALKLQVVAEGVEFPAQMDKLRQYDCDCIQGFVFSRPLPPEEAERLLDN